jgi:hypothetical protein
LVSSLNLKDTVGVSSWLLVDASLSICMGVFEQSSNIVIIIGRNEAQINDLILVFKLIFLELELFIGRNPEENWTHRLNFLRKHDLTHRIIERFVVLI